MPIAGLQVLNERGVQWQRDVFVEAADLDALCVHMCYVQLSMIGARARVVQQNTLSLEKFDEFITPTEMTGAWHFLSPRKAPAPAPEPAETDDDLSDIPWL